MDQIPSAAEDKVKRRRRSYRKKRSKQRLGRVERLKEAVQKRSKEVDSINHRAVVLRNLAVKVTTTNKSLKRYGAVVCVCGRGGGGGGQGWIQKKGKGG